MTATYVEFEHNCSIQNEVIIQKQIGGAPDTFQTGPNNLIVVQNFYYSSFKIQKKQTSQKNVKKMTPLLFGLVNHLFGERFPNC